LGSSPHHKTGTIPPSRREFESTDHAASWQRDRIGNAEKFSPSAETKFRPWDKRASSRRLDENESAKTHRQKLFTKTLDQKFADENASMDSRGPNRDAENESTESRKRNRVDENAPTESRRRNRIDENVSTESR